MKLFWLYCYWFARNSIIWRFPEVLESDFGRRFKRARKIKLKYAKYNFMRLCAFEVDLRNERKRGL